MRKTSQARQIQSHSVIKQKMAEFTFYFQLYFRVAFLALLLALASGELSIICNSSKACSIYLRL